MKKLVAVSLAAFAGSFLALALLGLPIVVRAGGGPATDKRFCADANGDGKIDVSDAVNILNFLFMGVSTPYCVAQGVSLEELSAQLRDVTARLAAVELLTSRAGLVATGNFIGDGTNTLRIETGLGGHIKFLRLWLDCEQDRCGRDDFTLDIAKTDLMPGDLGANTDKLRLDGSAFVIGAGDANERGRRYTWFAIATAPSD